MNTNSRESIFTKMTGFRESAFASCAVQRNLFTQLAWPVKEEREIFFFWLNRNWKTSKPNRKAYQEGSDNIKKKKKKEDKNEGFLLGRKGDGTEM